MGDTCDDFRALTSYYINVRIQRRVLAEQILSAAGIIYTEPSPGIWLIRLGKLIINFYPNKHRAVINGMKSQQLSPADLVAKVKLEHERINK